MFAFMNNELFTIGDVSSALSSDYVAINSSGVGSGSLIANNETFSFDFTNDEINFTRSSGLNCITYFQFNNGLTQESGYFTAYDLNGSYDIDSTDLVEIRVYDLGSVEYTEYFESDYDESYTSTILPLIATFKVVDSKLHVVNRGSVKSLVPLSKKLSTLSELGLSLQYNLDDTK